jgi:hypothetical protein
MVSRSCTLCYRKIIRPEVRAYKTRKYLMDSILQRPQRGLNPCGGFVPFCLVSLFVSFYNISVTIGREKLVEWQ